ISPRPAARRWRPAAVLGAAALIAALLGAGATYWASSGDRKLADRYRKTLAVAQGEYFTTVPLLAGRVELGYAFAYQGSPSWVFVDVGGPGIDGTYRGEATGADGVSRDPVR